MTPDRGAAPPSSPRLRLTVLASTLTVGGAEQLLLELLRNIDLARLHPEVLFLKDPGVIGREVLQLGYWGKAHLLRSGFDPSIVCRLSRILASRGTDVLLLINHRDTLFYGIPAARIARTPVVINWANETNRRYTHHRLTMLARRVLHLGVDRVVAAARGHRDYIAEAERIPLSKIVTIYNGVDPNRLASNLSREDARKELGLGAEAPVVSIIAALRPDKAHWVFLKAAGSVLQSGSDAQFLIVGEGPEKARLVRLAHELGIHSRTHFLGLRRDLGDILAAVDVNTLSSNPEQETLSVAALEAMAVGVPVVATNVGFMKEIVIPGETGYLAEPGNHQDLAEKMIRLLRDSELRTKLGQASRRLVEERFTISKMASAFQNLFLDTYGAKVGNVATDRTCRVQPRALPARLETRGLPEKRNVL